MSRTPEVIQLTDLLPTFVAAAGGKVDPGLACRRHQSAASWTGNAPVPERTCSGNGGVKAPTRLAALEGQFKLVVTRGGKPELYDVVGDPGERRDISAVHPEMTRQLRTELNAWLETETRR